MSPDDLRQIREGFGLSQSEFAGALGFGRNGADIVRSWEKGERRGDPFAPTPSILLLIRLLQASSRTLALLEDGRPQSAEGVLREALPGELL